MSKEKSSSLLQVLNGRFGIWIAILWLVVIHTIAFLPINFFHYNVLFGMVGAAPLLFVAFSKRFSNATGKPQSMYLPKVYLALLLWNIATTWWIWNSTPWGSVAAFVLNSFFQLAPWVLLRIFQKRTCMEYSLSAWVFGQVLFELGHENWDLSWSWLNLGNTLAFETIFAQWYSVTGALGGSLWLWGANAIIAGYLFRLAQGWVPLSQILRLEGPNLKVAFAWIFLPQLISLGMYGYTKYNIANANYPTSEIVVVQPNIDPFEKFDGGYEGAIKQVTTLVKLSEQAIGPDTRFLLWPETSITILVDEADVERQDIVQSLRRWLTKYPKVQLIAGLNSYKRMPPAPNGKMQEPIYYNTGLHLTAFGPATLYHKSKLVPGVEQMPYPELLNILGSLAIDLGGTVGSLGKQDQRTVFYDTSLEANSKVSPVICYESIYSDFVGGFARNGSTSIGVITNDAWWGNTPGHQQHFAYGKLRAIESRQMISRAANTGISGFIDEVGDVLQASKYDTQTVMKAKVRQHKSDTFYVRFGNWVPWVALFGLIVTIWLSFNHKASN